MRRRTATFLSVTFAVAILVSAGGSRLLSNTSQNKVAAYKPADPSRLDRFWIRAQQEAYRSPEELRAQNKREKRLGLSYIKLMRGDPYTKTIALTFDDGPHPQYTSKLLAILKKYHVKASFFVVGMMAEKFPGLVRQEAADGHLIGNHTYHHVNLTRIPDDEIPLEWQACNDVIKWITGKNPKFGRPPGGDYDSVVIKAAMSSGLTTVLWTDDPGDYANPGDKIIADRVLSRIHNGGIILLHDGSKQTIDVLPQIIETLTKRGFRFVTVDKMAKEAHAI